MRKIKVYAAAIVAAFLLLFCLYQPLSASALVIIDLESEFTVDELEPVFLPIVPMCDGKFWFEFRELDYAQVRNAFHEVSQEIAGRLAPFQACPPELVIAPLYIAPDQEEDISWNVGGWYSKSLNKIVLTSHSVNSGKDMLTYAFCHELGHWVWFQLLDDEKQEYMEIAGEPDEEDLRFDPDPEIITQEWFAEDFAKHACGVDIRGNGKVYSTPEKQRDKTKLEKYFQRFTRYSPAQVKT